MDAEALRGMADGVALNLDSLDQAQASAAALQIKLRELGSGSEVAAELLKDWSSAINRISLIMPRDYARVLAAIERATKDGLPVDQYVMEVAANG